MAPQLVVRRRLLRVQRVIGGEQTKTKTVQATVTLPVQAIKVFEVQATLKATKCEIKRDGGVFIQGTIHKQVFYVDQGGDLVRHVAEEVPFHFLSMSTVPKPA